MRVRPRLFRAKREILTSITKQHLSFRMKWGTLYFSPRRTEEGEVSQRFLIFRLLRNNHRRHRLSSHRLPQIFTFELQTTLSDLGLTTHVSRLTSHKLRLRTRMPSTSPRCHLCILWDLCVKITLEVSSVSTFSKKFRRESQPDLKHRITQPKGKRTIAVGRGRDRRCGHNIVILIVLFTIEIITNNSRGARNRRLGEGPANHAILICERPINE